MQYGLKRLLGAFAGNRFATIMFICGQNVCLQIDCLLGCENQVFFNETEGKFVKLFHKRSLV